MARSLVRLPGRGRVAGALGAGVLVGSLALVGCSSSSPKGGGTIPPLNTAGSGTGSSASASASGGASTGASGVASAGAVTAESLSDPTLGYTVVSIPKDLDTSQTKVLQDYVAYDKATWRVWSTRKGLDDALKRSTGTTRENIRNNYNKTTHYARPPISIGISDVEVDADGKSAKVTVCYDRTRMTVVDENGNDVTKDSSQNKKEYLIDLVDGQSGDWLAESQTTLSSDECSTEQK
ncbi:hypothetical protein BKH21_09200 [Actinomyces oris]|uniref:hypothetical protein n=1 Tax=Actinomyces oris TaxID=544580 RepID=UPI00094D9BFA|nr:hypothetical protein [Actinomyces oris]OLO66418.1 hypothetical protein BKH21_09200 [Actinomyces oris]